MVKGAVKTLKLRIKDPETIRLMSETVWNPSQMFTKRRDGSTIMTLKVTDSKELFSWILGWGDKVKVLQPQGLRQEIIKTAKAIQAVYEE